MKDFCSVSFKTVVQINGKEYILSSCDYSESVTQAIEDGVCEMEAQSIIDFIADN